VLQIEGDDARVVPLAPRYSHRIFDAVSVLDDPSEPMAETCRRVGAAAERMGLPRPSYSHLRRYIKEERERRAEIRQILHDVATELVAGKVPHPYVVMDRLQRAAG